MLSSRRQAPAKRGRSAALKNYMKYLIIISIIFSFSSPVMAGGEDIAKVLVYIMKFSPNSSPLMTLFREEKDSKVKVGLNRDVSVLKKCKKIGNITTDNIPKSSRAKIFKTTCTRFIKDMKKRGLKRGADTLVFSHYPVNCYKDMPKVVGYFCGKALEKMH